jgi:hypothetical protein
VDRREGPAIADPGDYAALAEDTHQARIGTGNRLREEAGAVVVSVTKVATGPMTEEEAAGIARFGDLTPYAPAIQKLAAGHG